MSSLDFDEGSSNGDRDDSDSSGNGFNDSDSSDNDVDGSDSSSSCDASETSESSDGDGGSPSDDGNCPDNCPSSPALVGAPAGPVSLLEALREHDGAALQDLTEATLILEKSSVPRPLSASKVLQLLALRLETSPPDRGDLLALARRLLACMKTEAITPAWSALSGACNADDFSELKQRLAQWQQSFLEEADAEAALGDRGEGVSEGRLEQLATRKALKALYEYRKRLPKKIELNVTPQPVQAPKAVHSPHCV